MSARRYEGVGRLYDIVSLEWLLYRRPRARLFEMLGPLPGTTVVDLGCGTGLNFPALRRLVGPDGRVVGVDAASSMLAVAERRARRAGWTNVSTVRGDVADVLTVLRAGGVELDEIGAVVATFVLSIVDDAPVWAAIGEVAAEHPVRVAVADLGRPDHAPRALGVVYGALTAVAGADPDRRPWESICTAGGARHEVRLGGHVHLATGIMER